MAFDSQTRNKLQRMVGACRRLLTDEFDDQLQGLYGIYAQDGRVLELDRLTTLDDDDYQIATLLRDRVKHLCSEVGGGANAEGGGPKAEGGAGKGPVEVNSAYRLPPTAARPKPSGVCCASRRSRC